MSVTINSILASAILIAFLLPAYVLVINTLPPPTNNPAAAKALNLTARNITYLITGTSANPTNKNKTYSVGSFNSNVTVVSAFAFILQGIGATMITIVQLPILDSMSLNALLEGINNIFPGVPMGFLLAGVKLLYIYMFINLLLVGVSLIQKYDARNG